MTDFPIRPLVKCALVFLAALPPQAYALPSFPGAQGGGAVSVGGRGGAVIHVTNLDDSGPGSLRECVLAMGPRTCVFRVGGTINLLSQIWVSRPFLTVAGQTAPGGGIQLSGKNSSENMVGIVTHDVILRYVRIRKGYSVACSDGTATDCGANIQISSGAHNVMVDHVSASWNQDEGIGLWSGTAVPVYNVTASWNLVAEGLASHPTGYLAGGLAPLAANMTDIDFHHNLTMNNNHRNPLLQNKSSRLVNNITYNQHFYRNQFGGGVQVDVIGNLYKKGPLDSKPIYPGYHEIQAFNTTANSAPGNPLIYLSGNKGWNQLNPAGDQWLLTSHVTGQNGKEDGAIPESWRRTTPLANTLYPIIAEPVANIEGSLLPIVGASRRLDCDGSWVANRDSVDTRLIHQYQTNTGIRSIPSTEESVGGFPVIPGGTPCTDTDHDGMPDGWEMARALNPNNAADRNIIAGSGYTNLEVYLAGVEPGLGTPSGITIIP